MAYLINRGPSIPLDCKIAEEVWSDKKVNLSFLKVFVCLSYVHIDVAARSKLDMKFKKCFFIGYGGTGGTEFGYYFGMTKIRKSLEARM